MTNDIRIIGPRRSGKTTYLATLAYFPHSKRLNLEFPGIEVMAGDDATAKLIDMAENIIKKGERLAGTRRGKDVDDLKEYFLRVKIPSYKRRRGADIELVTKDVAGEIFHDFSLEHKKTEMEPYFDDLFGATGWMVMLTDWEADYDTHLYKPTFTKLCQEIAMRQKINPAINNLRLAIVITKCERGELWPGRLDPEEDLFKARLPETYDILCKFRRTFPERLKFFACSSFGVLNTHRDDFDPRPNRYVPNDGSSADDCAFLRNATQWHPYGLFSPIYWLATGQTLIDSRL